jgi:hypothetical protein
MEQDAMLRRFMSSSAARTTPIIQQLCKSRSFAPDSLDAFNNLAENGILPATSSIAKNVLLGRTFHAPVATLWSLNPLNIFPPYVMIGGQQVVSCRLYGVVHYV